MSLIEFCCGYSFYPKYVRIKNTVSLFPLLNQVVFFKIKIYIIEDNCINGSAEKYLTTHATIFSRRTFSADFVAL